MAVAQLSNAVRRPLMEAQLDENFLPSMEDMSIKPEYYKVWCPLDTNMKTVDTKFGPVPFGSVLSYQMKETCTDAGDYVVLADVSRPPFQFPELEQSIEPQVPHKCLKLLERVQLSVEQCVDIEKETREPCVKLFEVNYNRLTATDFKRVYIRRNNFDTLLAALSKQNANMCIGALKRVQLHDTKANADCAKAVADYSQLFGRNVYKCGFFINPTATHLGCHPDGIVYDDEADQNFGLLEIRCQVDVDWISDCTYLKETEMGFKLKDNHAIYYKIMGQMGLTGYPWCDLYVTGKFDTHCERIYFDSELFEKMKERLDSFYFEHLLGSLSASVSLD